MKGLHEIKGTLRYDGLPYITEDLIRDGRGTLLDRWTENGYPLGLWEEQITHQRYIIHPREDDDYHREGTWMTPTQATQYYREQMEFTRRNTEGENWLDSEWWTGGEEYLVDIARRSTENVTALPPLDLDAIKVVTRRDRCEQDGHVWVNGDGEYQDDGQWCENCDYDRGPQ